MEGFLRCLTYLKIIEQKLETITPIIIGGTLLVAFYTIDGYIYREELLIAIRFLILRKAISKPYINTTEYHKTLILESESLILNLINQEEIFNDSCYYLQGFKGIYYQRIKLVIIYIVIEEGFNNDIEAVKTAKISVDRESSQTKTEPTEQRP